MCEESVPDSSPAFLEPCRSDPHSVFSPSYHLRVRREMTTGSGSDVRVRRQVSYEPRPGTGGIVESSRRLRPRRR